VKTVLAVLLALAALPSPAAAQRDRLGIGESLTGAVIRKDAATPEASSTTVVDQQDDRVVFAAGDLTLQVTGAPPQIRDAIVFLVMWGKQQLRGTPLDWGGRTMKVGDVLLVLPASGLSTVRSRDSGAVIGVRVARASLAGGPLGPLFLAMTPRRDGYTVTRVVVDR
jgi:hypothetical protein